MFWAHVCSEIETLILRSLELQMSDQQNAIQQNPVLGVRCIDLQGLVCHALTFACWFGLKPWG